MQSFYRRAVTITALALLPAIECAAQDQAFGLGARLSMVRGDLSTDSSAERFTGGQLRARVSPRTAIELSLDLRTQTSEDLTRRTRDVPVQASLLLYPVRSSFSPYVLGGGGWYNHRDETLLDNEVVDSQKSRKFGWHAGIGAELRMGRHAAVHADYRYTFLHFHSDTVETNTIAAAIATAHANDRSSARGFLPSYDGSMWTAGFTVYF